MQANELIEIYALKPHPEGGYFKETYRASGSVDGGRSYSTAIFFLLPKETRSTLHRINSDEVWHFYLGGPMTLVQLAPDGEMQVVVLGSDVRAGHKLQHVVPAGHWFGGYPNEGTEYCFVGCTVAPGFEFSDFEIAKRETLLRNFPQCRAIIERLT